MNKPKIFLKTNVPTMGHYDTFDPKDQEFDPDRVEQEEANSREELAKLQEICVHKFKVHIGSTKSMIDTFTCKKCGFVKYYQGGQGWVN